MKEVVLDIPHGGTRMPEEVKPYLHPEITDMDLLDAVDSGSVEFYNEQAEVPAENRNFFEYFRTIIDVNRTRNNFTRDGIVKKTTPTFKQLYRESDGLPEGLAKHLIQTYAEPYFGRLMTAVEKPETELVVLGHTMWAVGTAGGKDPGAIRPLINIANGGDPEGNPDQPYQMPRDVMEYIRDEIRERVGGLNLNGVVYNGVTVSINTPFRGLKSINRLGPERLGGKKALMLEVNKSLICESADSAISIVRPENIAVMRGIIHDLLEGVLGKITR